MSQESVYVSSGAGIGATAGNVSTKSGNPRKRQRTLISCTECHRRKQKCDRQWPCGNCTSRSASHLCQYERKVRKDDNSLPRGTDTGTESLHMDDHDSGGDQGDESDADLESLMITRKNASEFGYSLGVQNTSLNVLEKLDIGCDNQLHPVYSDRTFHFSNPADLNTYNNFIRLIPTRPVTKLLVQVFFTEVNFLYGTLHQATFNRMLDEWWNLATVSNHIMGEPIHSGGKTGGNDPYINNDIHFFPSLLLQVLSLAIQLLPREHYEYVSQVKLGMCETFQDFSTRLSNASCELAVLLGGTCTSSPSRVVQAFLRGVWLKNGGRMHEAWHSLGTAIRSAQEQGFHLENGTREAGGPGILLRGFGGAMRSTGPSSMGEQIRMMWYREMEKRVWINLYTWDRYMSMILGRPTMINDRHCTVTTPLDCEPPADFTSQEPTPRGVMDPPSSFTQRILDYRIAHLINEVEEITQRFNATSNPDFVRLDALHAKLIGFTESFPPGFSITNRDTTFDNIRPFLAVQAALLKSTFYSVIVALHRPYLFLREKSRKEIVRAALIMLECQDAILKLLQEHHHRIYAICFFTFDPCVLLSAVVITNSSGMDQATLEQALISLRAGWKRLRMLGVNVKLAEKGSVVLRVLLRKVEVIVEGLRWKNTSDEVDNDSVGGASGTSGRSNSPRPRNSGQSSHATDPQSNRSSTQGTSLGRTSPPQHPYRRTPEVSSTCSSPTELDRSNYQLDPNLSVATYLNALNTASSWGRHNQQHHTHHYPATMPLVWDSSVLIDLPVDQIGAPHIPPTNGAVMPGVSPATAFNFTKPTSHGGHGGSLPGFFDASTGFAMDTSTGLDSQIGSRGTGGMNGNHEITGSQAEDWGVPHGDGLWQNLLGMYGNDS